jgi:hypothetical protein
MNSHTQQGTITARRAAIKSRYARRGAADRCERGEAAGFIAEVLNESETKKWPPGAALSF